MTRDELDHDAKRGVHQGVVADVERRTEATLEDLAQTAEWAAADRRPRRGRGPAERRRDPAQRRCLRRVGDRPANRRAAPLDGAAAKASAGAVNHVPVADVVNIARSLEELKKAGIWTVGLDAGAKMAYYEWDLTLPTAIVVGAEGHGLRRLVRERCDQVVSIPMLGHVGSLNVSVATAVVLYEAVRQRRSRSRGR